MNIKQTESGFSVVISLILVVVLGLISAVAATTANAARPGDFLFPLDTAIENTRITLAFSPESEVNLRTNFAAERVEEIKSLLEEKGVDAPGIDVALANLEAHKASVADLVTKEQTLKSKAKLLEDSFEQQEAKLKSAFKAAELELKLEKTRLEVQLDAAEASGDVAVANQLRSQIIRIETNIESLDAQHSAAEKTLELDEKKLEAQFEEKERLLETQEESLDKEQDKLEQEAERLEEEQEKLSERKKESDEKETEQIEQEQGKLEDEAAELQEQEELLKEEKDDLEKESVEDVDEESDNLQAQDQH